MVRPVSGLLTVDFNPRSPDGERRQTVGRLGLIHGISIHAPRMGSDAHGNCRSDRGYYFNPRSPDGERRCRRLSDARCSYFNPRSPDGERPLFLSRSDSMGIFQSTLPGWGATITDGVLDRIRAISIHAPRMGSDLIRRLPSRADMRISIHAPRMGSDMAIHLSAPYGRDFNPRSPDGERPLRIMLRI